MGIEKIDYYFSWGYISISEIKKDIEELEKLGATHVDIGIELLYGDAFVNMQAYRRDQKENPTLDSGGQNVRMKPKLK